MTTFTWKDVLVAEQRHKDLLEHAKQAREAAPRLQTQQGLSFSARWLYAFGEQLVSWGCRLQARYRQVLPQRSATSQCEPHVVHSAMPGHI